MLDGWHVLVREGVVLSANPGPASAFLRSALPGAYTTTRTAFGASYLLLWQRHVARLCDSLQILANTYPKVHPSLSQRDVKSLLGGSLASGLERALQLRRPYEEIAITVLLCPKDQKEVTETSSVCHAYVHASNYVPAHEGDMPPAIAVAIMGPGRTLPGAKYSMWASVRQGLDACRPQGATEIILSNDGDSLLEGTLTNFFVVAKITAHHLCRGQATRSDDLDTVAKGGSDWSNVELQTAPLEDGVLPGVIRSMVLEVCEECGIPCRETAPSWAHRHTWTEAFVTSSIRILQPVTKVQRPTTWNLTSNFEQLSEGSWDCVEFEACGEMTRTISKLVLKKSWLQSIPIREIFGKRESPADFDTTL